MGWHWLNMNGKVLPCVCLKRYEARVRVQTAATYSFSSHCKAGESLVVL